MTFTPYLPKDIPQKFNYLVAMKIIIDLEFVLAGQESIIAIALKNAIKGQVPAETIISNIKDFIVDNEDAMGFILGNDLLNQIKNYK